MSQQEACPVPGNASNEEAELIRRLLGVNRIAVVGLSPDPGRPSYAVAEYMQRQGKTIIPVNPTIQAWKGAKSYPDIESVPGSIELVNVFRRPEYCPDIVRSTIRAGIKAVWLQSGIRSPEAKALAREAGIDYIEDRCMMVQHMRAGM